MTGAPPLWIKNLLAIVADSAAVSGLVIADVVVFDASEHVVLPGLINTHQHLHKILSYGIGPAAIPMARSPLSYLGKTVANSFLDRHSPGRGGAAIVGDNNDFGSSLRLSWRL